MPIKPHQEIQGDVEFRESKVFGSGGRGYIHLTIRKEVETKEIKDKKQKAINLERSTAL